MKIEWNGLEIEVDEEKVIEYAYECGEVEDIMATFPEMTEEEAIDEAIEHYEDWLYDIDADFDKEYEKAEQEQKDWELDRAYNREYYAYGRN